MKDENLSDLFGDSVEEVEFHKCSRDKKENQDIDSEDQKRMLFLLTHREVNSKQKPFPVEKAKALVNEYL